MAFTASDLATIEQAIASGTMRVRFADGREVTYQDIAGLMRARVLIQSEVNTLAGNVRPRTTVTYFGRD
jgi:hypothetical protein